MARKVVLPRGVIDITGQRFTRLVVVRRAAKRYWLCRCDCGKTKAVRKDHLIRGKTLSCGCLHGETTSRLKRIHGGSNTPEYRIWQKMRRRCYCPTDPAYSLYGGRGITVCGRWNGKDGFANFLADMGRRPSRAHSTERKDNDGPYSPENCVWATMVEQSQNRRSNRLLTFRGETMCVSAWARRMGMSTGMLHHRIERGWDTEDALTTPWVPQAIRMKARAARIKKRGIGA